MKIHKITLKDKALVETTDGYEIQFSNEKTYPLYLTHAALQEGHNLGILDGSLVSDLLRISGAADNDSNALDDTRMYGVIYLAFVGANPSIQLSYEDFLEKLHYSSYELFEIYSDIVQETVTSNKNSFAEEIEKSIDSSTGKK